MRRKSVVSKYISAVSQGVLATRRHCVTAALNLGRLLTLVYTYAVRRTMVLAAEWASR